ncbi:MAG: UxaA family hydrolase [Dehalococcoidia bacterium]|nr:UxaA family hydrolase [Dehalococcoidia bacterium]
MDFPGYERPGGRAGIRNYVSIIPVTSCSNELACAIADGAAGSVPILHNYGCMRLKPDNDRAHRTLAGLGSNPNVAATLLVEMGCGMLDPEAMAQEIAATGTPVELLSVKSVGGYYKAIEAGQAIVRSMMAKASLQQRVPLPLNTLSVGIKCGGSATISSAAGHPATGYVVDTIIDEGGTAIFSETAEVIGAEHLLARRAANEQVKCDLLETVGRFEQMIVDYGVDIRGAQPTPGNIMSGLTTIEEKSLGALVKTGTRPLSGVVDYGVQPSAPGLYLMDSTGWPCHMFLGMAAAGSQVFIFSLGGGVCGLFPSQPGAFRTPIVPTIKITGDPTLKPEVSFFDYYAGTVIEGRQTKAEASEEFLRVFLDVVSGKPTTQEYSTYREVLDMFASGPVM